MAGEPRQAEEAKSEWRGLVRDKVALFQGVLGGPECIKKSKKYFHRTCEIFRGLAQEHFRGMMRDV